MNDRELTPEAQSDRDDFDREYSHNGNCSCGSCTHPGNPLNQEEDDTAWINS